MLVEICKKEKKKKFKKMILEKSSTLVTVRKIKRTGTMLSAMIRFWITNFVN